MVRVLLAVVAGAVALAAPATADQNDYLRKLHPKYNFLSQQQLLTVGAKVCDALRRGVPGSDAALLVQDELGVSGSAAGTIVATAAVELEC